MSKPETIIAEYKLNGWTIEQNSPGFDVGDVGPDFVPFEVHISWSADSDFVRPDKAYHTVTKNFRTLEEAKTFLFEETGIEA